MAAFFAIPYTLKAVGTNDGGKGQELHVQH